MKTSILLSMFAFGAATCPNACSSNGICGAQDKCSCYQNWQGADCSQRSCPFTLAWADTADGTNQAHYYAECGNKGTCDRKSGECKCFDGYEGKGCRRSTCPEGCSGHGTCEYIEELGGDFADRRNGPGNKYKDLTCNSQINSAPGTGAEDPAFRSCRGLTMRTCGGTYDNTAAGTCTLGGVDVAFIGGECDGGSGSGGTGCDSSVAIDNSLITSTVTARSANTDKYNGHQYQLWDAGKIQGCKCDLGYEGADCATREVPRGDDPLTTVKATTQVQQVQISGTIVANDQFYMRFYDAYGGVWVTNTITVPGAGTVAHDTTVAALVQDQLRGLPNGVLSGVTVAASTITADTTKVCHRFEDGGQHISAYSQTTDGNYRNSKGRTNFCESGGVFWPASSATAFDFAITMGNVAGQTGVQYLLEVDVTAQGAGSFPVSKGFTNAVTSSVAEINYNDNLGNLSELSDCSDRGLDDGEGQCECFDGYRGLACEEQEALV